MEEQRREWWILLECLPDPGNFTSVISYNPHNHRLSPFYWLGNWGSGQKHSTSPTWLNLLFHIALPCRRTPAASWCSGRNERRAWLVLMPGEKPQEPQKCADRKLLAFQDLNQQGQFFLLLPTRHCRGLPWAPREVLQIHFLSIMVRIQLAKKASCGSWVVDNSLSCSPNCGAHSQPEKQRLGPSVDSLSPHLKAGYLF